MSIITKEEATALFQEFQNTCDETVFNKIYQQFKSLAVSRVNKLIDNNCEHLRADLESEAYEALWKAAKMFDFERGYLFTTYATRCIDHAIHRKLKKYRGERQHNKELNYTYENCVIDGTSDNGGEIAINDPFPCRRESILTELKRFCTQKELAIIELICNDEDIRHKNGNLNNAAIARKVGISREAVRRIVENLGTDQSLRSTISELTPR